MRELKFRAWDKELELMLTRVSFRMLEHEFDIESLEFAGRYKKSRILLMQYTGLGDSAGKEIYEGDILEWSDENLGTLRGRVVWNDVPCGFTVITERGLPWFMPALSDSVVVIGNIYETPEKLPAHLLVA